jgi:hypothetical protein
MDPYYYPSQYGFKNLQIPMANAQDVAMHKMHMKILERSNQQYEQSPLNMGSHRIRKVGGYNSEDYTQDYDAESHCCNEFASIGSSDFHLVLTV